MVFGLSKSNPDLKLFAEILSESVTKLFFERGEIKFSKPPEMTKRTILEYQGRMRADGMEKFNGATYVATLNYYLSAKDMEKKNALGALILYVEQGYMASLVRLLKYPVVDDENEEALKDSCGTFCNIIGGHFKSEISAKGYTELEMSHFSTYRNNASNGVAFCYNEYEKYEINFYIENAKRVALEVTMGLVPKRR